MTDHTYDALVGSLALGSKSLARYWLRDMPDPSWDEPSEFGLLVTPSTQNSAAALLLRQALADTPAYNLTVMNGEVLVLYELAETSELSAQGGRYLAFAGDYTSVTVGSEITLAPPGFVELHGSASRAATARNFETRNVPILEWDAIKTALDGDATIALVDRAVAPAADPNAAAGAAAPVAPTRDVHPVLPVPLHVALLFMTPCSARAAFHRGDALREIIPDNQRANYAPLFNFLRAAITQSENDAELSALQSDWRALALAAGSPIWHKYHRMLHQIKPPEEPLLGGGGGGGSNGGGGGGNDGGSDPPLPTPTDKAMWHQHQLEILWSVAGIDKDEWVLQTESSLPELYQGLKKFRASSVSSRQYLVQQWGKWKSTERFSTEFVMSTALISAIRNLDFDGGDIAATWEGRGKGLSYFALGPHEMFKSGRYIQTMDDQRVFEATEEGGQLTLKDRQTHGKAEIVNPVPTARLQTVCQLDAVGDRLHFLFGENCQVMRYLKHFAELLTSEAFFSAWGTDDWLAFNWHVHVAMRRVWTKCATGVDKTALAYLARIQSDLEVGRSFPISACPPQIRESHKRDADKAGLPPGKGAANETKKKAEETTKSPIAGNFTALLERARKACKNPKEFSMNKVLPTADDWKYVMGQDFRACTKGNPCGKFFLNKCSGKRCFFTHELEKTPEKAVLEGMVARFKEKVDAYTTAQASKG